ncbi:MFS transporter [Xanthobacter sp. DSM 24535]|uniref:MFS transporter n=1 Tax=Roseixanthobacter psychrophilus TaxID=3119917 RepID=UPI00372A3580
MQFALFRSHGALFLAVFLDIFSFGLMYPLIVGLFDGPGFGGQVTPANRDLMMSLAFALFPIGAFFGCALLGDLSDALGRRRTLVVCMAGLALGYALMWLSLEAAHLWLFFAGRVVAGLMSGTAPIAQASMVDAVAPEARGDAMAQVTVVNTVGLMAGPAIGGVLGHYDFRLPLAFALVLCAFNAVMLARSRFGEETRRRAFHFDWRQPFLLFARLKDRPQVIAPLASFFLFQLGFLIYYTFILVVMQRDHGFTTAQIGLFSVVMGVGFMIGSALCYAPVARWLKQERLIALFGEFGCGVLLVLTALPVGATGQVALALLICIANVFSYVSLLSAMSGAVDETERGWVMGLSAASVALCVFISGLLTGLLTVLPATLFLGTGGVLVLLAIAPALRIAPHISDASLNS